MIEVSILEKYGDRIYYLDFDRFLIKQNVLEKIIKIFSTKMFYNRKQ